MRLTLVAEPVTLYCARPLVARSSGPASRGRQGVSKSDVLPDIKTRVTAVDHSRFFVMLCVDSRIVLHARRHAFTIPNQLRYQRRGR